jgi:hypothetical protein
MRPVTTRMPPDLLFKLLTVYAATFHLIQQRRRAYYVRLMTKPSASGPPA